MNAGERKLRIAVIGGGRNCEHEVSLASAAGVAAGLEDAGCSVMRLTIDRDGEWLLNDTATGSGSGPGPSALRLGLPEAIRLMQECDAVFPVLHGPRGEDGTLAALCELIGVAYVGSGVAAGAIAMDKWATKLVAQQIGIATAPGVLLTAATAGRHRWTRPVVVKPVASGSSHGVALVEHAEQLPAALAAAFALDSRVLVEEVVTGREIDLAVFGYRDGSRVVGPALEIVGEGLFDLETKYDGSADFRLPAQLSADERARLEAAALAMYDALGCAGVARIDFFLTADGPLLNEVNTMPGFTAQSQVPKMFAAVGVPYAELLRAMVLEVVTPGEVPYAAFLWENKRPVAP
ncbi:MAG: D-alanine--D-alanine ligase [Actinobacteria bacterium]|nr:D-alanine--D-alanine ligase [Actinomycetota bacterium]